MVSTPPRTVPLTGSEPFNFRHDSFGDGEPLAIHVNSVGSPIFTRDFRGVTVTLGASKNKKVHIFRITSFSHFQWSIATNEIIMILLYWRIHMYFGI